MLGKAIVSFKRNGWRYVLVDKYRQLALVDICTMTESFERLTCGNIIFINGDLIDIPEFTTENIALENHSTFACKIIDFYSQNTEKKALVLLVEEFYS